MKANSLSRKTKHALTKNDECLLLHRAQQNHPPFHLRPLLLRLLPPKTKEEEEEEWESKFF